MSATALTARWELNSVADTALKTAARFWFLVTVAGQRIFAFYVASFYGSSAARGDLDAHNPMPSRRFRN